MPKVLLILENDPNASGGIERHCRNLADMFDGHPTIAVAALSKKDVPFRTIRAIHKILFNREAMKEAVIRSQCDVIHVHGFASLIIPQVIDVARELGKKIIYTAHFHPFCTLSHPLQGKLFFYFFIRPRLKYLHAIVTINNEDLKFFQKYHNRVVRIPNWLTGLPHLQLPRQKNSILFVGRNTPGKGIEYLNEIPLDKYQVNCVTNSDTGLKPGILVHKDLSDEELSRFYSCSELLVAPSRYEAFSYVVLEALERGTPVLISDQVRIADHLEGVDGVTIFRYGDKKDFADKLAQAIEKSVDTEKIREIFSPDKIKQLFSKLYCS